MVENQVCESRSESPFQGIPFNPRALGDMAGRQWQQVASQCQRHLQSFGGLGKDLFHQERKDRVIARSIPGSPRRVFVRSSQFAAAIPGDSLAEAVITSGISNFLNLYNAAIIARLVLTWFPNPPQIIAGPLSTICDPYLNLFRGIIPPLGGTIDLSPILAFITLDLFTNSAAALPADIPKDMDRMAAREWQARMASPSAAARAWQRRRAAERAQRKDSAQ